MTGKPCGYVYCIKNLINGKRYIGKTSRALGSRWKEHLVNAIKGKRGHLYDAIRDSGAKNFEFDIVEWCYGDDEELSAMEMRYIQEMDTHYDKNGYNGDVGGGGRKRKKKLTQAVIDGNCVM